MINQEPIGIMVFIEGKHARQEYVYKTVTYDDGSLILTRLYGEDGIQYIQLSNKKTYKVIPEPVEEFIPVDLLGIRWFDERKENSCGY